MLRDEDQERCADCGSLVCICCDERNEGEELWAAHCRECEVVSMSYEHETEQDAADWWNSEMQKLNKIYEMIELEEEFEDDYEDRSRKRLRNEKGYQSRRSY